MRYVRIFLLYFQEAFSERGRSFVWFLITLLNPLLYLVFWYGASGNGKQSIVGWDMQSITSYYFLLVIAGSLLLSHIEETIGYWHIYQGRLTGHLLKPISYYLTNFVSEMPWRIIQGFFGVIAFLIFKFFLGNTISLTSDTEIMLLAICSCICAYVLSFTVKTVIGISAFWLVGYHGLAEAVGMFQLIAGGFLVPLYFFPDWLRKIVFFLPFPYEIYIPIIAWQGKLSHMELVQAIMIQLAWIGAFLLLFRILWRRGSREYTGVSQ